MSDEIKALADELRGFASACGGRPGDGSFAVSIHDGKLSFIKKTRPSAHDIERALVSVLREAATALDRLSGRVTMKALPRSDGTGGWTLPMDLLKDMEREVTAQGWDGQTPEVVEIIALSAERRILAAIDTAPAPSPDQIRREALKDAQRIAVRIMREEEAHGGDIARERAGAAEEIAVEIEALITGGDDDAA